MTTIQPGTGMSPNFLEAAESARAFGKISDGLLDQISTRTANLLAVRVSQTDASQPTLLSENATALRAPANTSGLSLTALLGKLSDLLGHHSLATLRQRLDTVLAKLQLHQQGLNELDKELQKAQEQAVALGEEATQLTGDAEIADAEARKAREEAIALAEELKAADPASEGYAKLQQRAEQAGIKADELGGIAEQKLTDAADGMTRLDEAQAKVQGLLDKVPVGSPIGQGVAEKAMAGVGEVTALLGKLHELISKNSQIELDKQSRLTQDQLEKVNEANIKRAKEYEAEQAKARDLQKKMGSWGKLIGWVATVVFTVAAFATGGAAIPLAAASLAMMLHSEITGNDIIGKAMTDVIEKVFTPMMKFFSNIVSKALLAVGVDKDIAELVGAIAGAIQAALVMVAATVAVAVVGKAAAARFMAKFGETIARHISRIVPQLVKNVGKSMGKTANGVSEALKSLPRSFGQSFPKVTSAIKSTTSYALPTATVLMAGNTIAQGVTGAIVAGHELSAAKAKAAIERAIADTELLKQLMDMIIEAYAATSGALENMRELLSEVIAQQTSAGMHVLRNMRG